MTSSLQQLADIITRAAGWKAAVPDADGVFRFALEDGLDFELLSPENSTGVLLATLKPAPAEGDPEAERDLQKFASLAAGCMKKRRSVFGLGESGFELYRSFRMADASESSIVSEVRDFLNDLAWWKRQISGSSNVGASASPFSFSFGGLFSADSFQG